MAIQSTCEEINRNPSNTSRSKQLYSFGKAERFSNPKEKTQGFHFLFQLEFSRVSGPRIIYSLPPVKAHRTTGMGYGTKYDFTKMVNGNPGPNSYKNVSIFDPNESKKRGFTMGPGRDVLPFVGFSLPAVKRETGNYIPVFQLFVQKQRRPWPRRLHSQRGTQQIQRSLD